MATKKRTTKRAARTAKSITLEEFTTETYSAVLRAVELQGRKRFLGPVIFGFIWWPDGPDGRPQIPVPQPKPRG